MELKPCPFCGGTKISLCHHEYSWHRAQCETCRAIGASVSIDRSASAQAVAEAYSILAEAWNRRADSVPKRECQCSMRTKLVGDGCEVCNPELALDHARENTADLELEVAALAAQNRELREILELARDDVSESLDNLNVYKGYPRYDAQIAEKIQQFCDVDDALALPDLSTEPLANYRKSVLQEVARMMNDTPAMLVAYKLKEMIDEH